VGRPRRACSSDVAVGSDLGYYSMDDQRGTHTGLEIERIGSYRIRERAWTGRGE
jgi:hypothetical protein